MPDLPEELLLDIFIRLPARSLLRFRCLSKSFCNLIDTPRFRSMHDELSNLEKNTSIMFCDVKRKTLYTIDYISVLSLLPLSASSTRMCEFMNQLNYPSIFQNCKVEFLSSCKGLVWICRSSPSWGEEYRIWTPSTDICKKIPMAPEVKGYNISGYGFGYDYKTNDYKLVRFVVDWESECSHVDVYTSGSNSWRNTQSLPYYLYYASKVSCVHFNGALLWLARTFEKQSTVLIISFDIFNERFEEVAVPEVPMPPEEPSEKDMFDIDLGVLGGCLCLFFHVFNARVDVWMMQDYRVRESWTKSFSITHETIVSSTHLELIWSFNNNEILWDVDQGLVLCDPNTKRYKYLVVDQITHKTVILRL